MLLPEVGVTSETFLRWDVQSLAPHATVVVADPPPYGETITGAPAWDTAGAPALIFEPADGDLLQEVGRRAAVEAFLHEHGVEVVLIEYLDFADRWFDFLRSLGVRIALRGHGVDVSARLREPRWRQVYRRYATADAVIVPSRAAARRLVALGLPEHVVSVVRYCVEVPAARPDSVCGTVGEVRCVAVGRLVAKKAPLVLLEAFRVASTVDQRLRLDLVGSGPLMPAVQQFVRDQGLTDRIRLHGRLPHDETLTLTRRGDIFLHHAITAPDDGDAEGQPLSILEAMAAGVPVVATDHEGIPEVINDGANGRLVAEGDAGGMARALLDLAAKPIDRERLGRAARTTILHEYTAGHTRTMLLELLGMGPGVTT